MGGSPKQKKERRRLWNCPWAHAWVIYTENGWVRVQGPQGEMGWMRSEDVRLDREAPKKRDRRADGAFGRGAPVFRGTHLWGGGRSGHKKGGASPTGVDSSGLVNLAYRAVCLNAPRDAHEQFLVANKLINASDLQPGDWVFLAKKDAPDRIVHVMLFEKKGTLIEAAKELNKVRRVSFKKKLGVPQKDLHHGDKAGDFVVKVGTFLE